MSKKNTFVFNLDWYEILKDFSAEVRFEVYEAIMCYASKGELPTLSSEAKVAMAFIRHEMDRKNASTKKARQNTMTPTKPEPEVGGSADTQAACADPKTEEDRRISDAEAQLRLRTRYERRVRPDYRHLINFTQYRRLHFDKASDEHLNVTLQKLRDGTMRLSDIERLIQEAEQKKKNDHK